MDKYLSDLYYDPLHPAGFGGVAAIKRAAKKGNKNISVKEIKTWLQVETLIRYTNLYEERFVAIKSLSRVLTVIGRRIW
ncbi:hypothetical protein HOLleu_09368 [Holothuria leucospilota]|uniref:Uncharacterized protein n=1 Tax=Holothuria leucospilota TaxID=206669 RepID=A0A9Q1HEW7_HOLLE|nr:hypothetical protein HOLleu_09368 [Holothuria leucospilota]